MIRGKCILIPVKLLLSGCLLLGLLAGCAGLSGSRDNLNRKAGRDFFAMDTFFAVTAYGTHAEEGADAAEAEMHRLEKLLSTEVEESDIARLNREGRAEISDETARLLGRAVEIGRGTGGEFHSADAFNIAVYPLMQAWGFVSGEHRVPPEEEIASLLANASPEALILNTDGTAELRKPGMAVDLGGIAKGYASERLIAVLGEHGVSHAIADLGGNIVAVGTRPDGEPWRVGIRDPEGTDNILGVIAVTDKAVITSGGYERYFEQDGVRYHHILDPATGYPADSGLLSATVVSGDPTLADALSTALFVMGEEKACDYWRQHREDFDMVLCREDGTILATAGLKEELEPRRECSWAE